MKVSLIISLDKKTSNDIELSMFNQLTKLIGDVKTEIIFISNDSDVIQQVKSYINYSFCVFIYDPKANSESKLRNIAACQASGEFLVFHEINTISWNNFYEDIEIELSALNMSRKVKSFMIIPCLYLSPQYYTFIQKKRLKVDLRCLTIDYLQYGLGKNFILFDSSASVIVVNKSHFYSIGGFNEMVLDRYGANVELVSRLYSENGIFPKSDESLKCHYDEMNIRDYEFYLDYSLYGMRSLTNGLIMFSVWDTQKHRFDFGKSKETKQIISEMHAYENMYSIKPALHSQKIASITLLVWDKYDIYNHILRQVMPYFGTVINTKETEFKSECDFGNFITERNINQVIFANPYLNAKTLSLYNYVRKKQISFFIFERGALPDSWFFDPYGFNADSATFKPEKWLYHELTTSELCGIKNYVDRVKSSSDSLEYNNNRSGKDKLLAYLNKYHDLKGRKILYISLQRYSDTVSKFFAAEAKNYDGFIVMVNEVVQSLDKEQWLVIAKKHPLETRDYALDNQVEFLNDLHIHDLLDVCDKVLLLNSGVGVLAMMFNKHVIHVGDAFYSHSLINSKCKTTSEIVAAINGNFIPTEKVILQFLYYLRFKVYSFGAPKTITNLEPDNTFMTATNDINFYEVRIPGIIELTLNKFYTPITNNAPVRDFRTSLTTIINDDLDVIQTQPRPKSRSQKILLMAFYYWLKLVTRNSLIISELKLDPRKFFYNSKSRFTKIIGKLIY